MPRDSLSLSSATSLFRASSADCKSDFSRENRVSLVSKLAHKHFSTNLRGCQIRLEVQDYLICFCNRPFLSVEGGLEIGVVALKSSMLGFECIKRVVCAGKLFVLSENTYVCFSEIHGGKRRETITHFLNMRKQDSVCGTAVTARSLRSLTS